MSTIDQLSRRALQAMKPYSVTARDMEGDTIFLNANENPYPRQYQLTENAFNRYPEPQPTEMIENYAKFLGVEPDNILVSLGGDESIELIIKAFCEPREDYLLYCPPTFGMYQITCDVMGIETIQIPLNDDFSLDTDAILAEVGRAKVIFLCSPNNPTGNTMDRESVIAILEATKGQSIVVLDEAYIEFAPEESMLDLIDQYPHLAIIRTLSKAFGLAGIRCGFTVGSRAIIDVLKKVIAPYPLPIPVIDLATQTVDEEGIAYMQETVARIAQNRDQLALALSELPAIKKVYEGRGNWLLVQCNNADGLFQHLLDNEIHVRSQKGAKGIEDTLRISIGTEEENAILLKKIDEFRD